MEACNFLLSTSSLSLLYSKNETFLPASVQVPQNNWLRFKYFYIFFLGKKRTLLKFTFIHFGELQRHYRQENRYDCFHWWKISLAACHWSHDYFSLVWKTVRLIRICAVYHFKRQFPLEWISARTYWSNISHFSNTCDMCNPVSTTCEGTK